MFWSETDTVRLQGSIQQIRLASGLLFCWNCYASQFWQNHWQNLLVIYEHIFSSSPRPAMARDCIDSRLLPMARHKRKEGISLAPVLKEEEAGLNIWRRKTKYDLKYTKTNRFYTKKRLWSRVTCHISHVSAPQSPKDWLLNGWGWQIKWVMDNVRAFFLNCIIFSLLLFDWNKPVFFFPHVWFKGCCHNKPGTRSWYENAKNDEHLFDLVRFTMVILQKSNGQNQLHIFD